MTDFKTHIRVLATIALLGMSLVGASAVVMADAQSSPSVPVSVSTQYVGNATTADHAFALQITVAPTDQTLNTTRIDVQSTERAFISSSSIETVVSTQDGRQVVTRPSGEGEAFRIRTLHPGESVTIELLLYPQQLVPNGDPLATVDTMTQFESNQQVLSDQEMVSPDLEATAVSIVASPSPSRVVTGVVGLVGGSVLVAGATGIIWWRRKARIRRIAQGIESAAVNNETRQYARELYQLIGRSESTDDTSDETQLGATESQQGTADDSTTDLDLVEDLD